MESKIHSSSKLVKQKSFLLVCKAGLWKDLCQCTSHYQIRYYSLGPAWLGYIAPPIHCRNLEPHTQVAMVVFQVGLFKLLENWHRMFSILLNRTHKHLDKAWNTMKLIPGWIRSVCLTQPETTRPCPVSPVTAASCPPSNVW